MLKSTYAQMNICSNEHTLKSTYAQINIRSN